MYILPTQQPSSTVCVSAPRMDWQDLPCGGWGARDNRLWKYYASNLSNEGIKNFKFNVLENGYH